MTLTLRSTILSDPGLVRSNNEDAGLAGDRLLAVADGMGGLPAGEVASEIVIGILAEVAPPAAPEAAQAMLRAAISTANNQIRAAIGADPERDGMGTTVTAAILAGANSSWRRSGTPAAICCATGGCDSSPATTRSCRNWSTRASSPRSRPGAIRSVRW